MDKRSYIQSKIMMFCLVSHFGESFYRDIVLQSKCQTVFYRAKNSRMCNGINTYHTSQVVHVSNSFYHKLKLVSEYRRIFHLVTVLFPSDKYIHAFTDRSSLYIDFLNTLVHRLFTVLNCIDTFTCSYFSLSFIYLSFKS